MDHSHIRAYFLAIVTTLLTVLVVYMLRPFLVTVGLAAVFAVIFAPLYRKIARRLPPTLAALTTVVSVVICVALPLSLLGIQLFKEAENIFGSISQPGSIVRGQQVLIGLGQSLDSSIPGASAYLNSLSENIGAYARQGLRAGVGYAGAIFTGTLSFLLQLFVFLMTFYYFLKEGALLRRAAKRFSPLTDAETEALFARLATTINSVVRGTLVIALIQGVLTGVGLFIFGVPNSVLLGTIAVIGALIPTVGTALVFVPVILYQLFIGHAGTAIGLALYGLLFVGIMDNALRPYLVGSRARIHPLLILLSVLGGIAFFGPAGLFLGPLVISLLLGLLYIYAPAEEV